MLMQYKGVHARTHTFAPGQLSAGTTVRSEASASV